MRRSHLRCLVAVSAEAIRRNVLNALEADGDVTVDIVDDGEAALRIFKDRCEYRPDIVVLSALLGRVNVPSVVKGILRTLNSRVPIYVIGDRTGRRERLALAEGAREVIDAQGVATTLMERVSRRRMELYPILGASPDQGYDVESVVFEPWMLKGILEKASTSGRVTVENLDRLWHQGETLDDASMSPVSELLGWSDCVGDSELSTDVERAQRPRLVLPTVVARELLAAPEHRELAGKVTNELLAAEALDGAEQRHKALKEQIKQMVRQALEEHEGAAHKMALTVARSTAAEIVRTAVRRGVIAILLLMAGVMGAIGWGMVQGFGQ